MVRVSVYLSFFFFKQKTAYEMRISDWSSDVCSSDLVEVSEQRAAGDVPHGDAIGRHGTGQSLEVAGKLVEPAQHRGAPARHRLRRALRLRATAFHGHGESGVRHALGQRSEEHTSELQSLMRISYAVFCLQKKT